ncbi:MAG: hypothetical protein RDV48_11280 [Candidatus Eremiobacteraeota bacterium]|nr:hypothetical protein [Candidatus Eremiobacteraeota bacterium]
MRLTISMPLSTLNLLNEVAERNGRSRFIAEAVEIHAQELKKELLRKRLKEGYLARADRDRALAEEWSSLEEDSIHDR